MEHHVFTNEQTDWLKDNFFKCEKASLTKRFNKKFGTNITMSSLAHKCFRLNLKHKTNRAIQQKAYTKEQLNWLKSNMYLLSLTDLTNQFNRLFEKNKNENGINQKIRELGYRTPFEYITSEQEQWLKDNFFKYHSYIDVIESFNNHFNTNVNNYWIESRTEYLGLTYEFTNEEIKWLKANAPIYNQTETTKRFNEHFNKNYTRSKIGRFCRTKLNIYFKESEQYKSEFKEIRSLPIGTEIVKQGKSYIKTSNKEGCWSKRWSLTSRTINNANDDDEVYIIDPNKPITKENTIVTKRLYHKNISDIGFNSLTPNLKPLAIKIAQLKYLHKHYEDKGEIKNGSK